MSPRSAVDGALVIPLALLYYYTYSLLSEMRTFGIFAAFETVKIRTCSRNVVLVNSDGIR